MSILDSFGDLKGGFSFSDPRLVKKHVKQCRAWRFECPESDSDLEFQIYFSRPFTDLILDKKISKLVDAIILALKDPKFVGNFKIDVVPEVKAIIITSPGFWKNFAIAPDDFSNAIEAVCEKIL
jgi:hypothetical protein